MKQVRFETLVLDKIVGGGQALGTLSDGRKAFVWGGLPGERVTIRLTKVKKSFVEGVVTEVITPSPQRITPKDPASYLSTSPWQIMEFGAEQHYKAALIEEAFELHSTVLPHPITVYTDNNEYHYRNKVEFSWYSDTSPSGDTLDLAFFRRGSKGKVAVTECALLPDGMLKLAHELRDLLRQNGVTARQLKTLLIRCDQRGNCVWQLYTKDPGACTGCDPVLFSNLPAQGGEIIYSDPRSPASRITERLHTFGNPVLTDSILGVPFRYATEGFFQINIPVYEQALKDMRIYVDTPSSHKQSPAAITKRVTRGGAAPTFEQINSFDFSKEGADRAAGPASSDLRSEAIGRVYDRSGERSIILDLYSGVGSIGLTIGGDNVELVEINADAVREMEQNIQALGKNAKAILAPSEKALDYITSDKLIIVDPPRAGLHADVVHKLLEAEPQRIVYLSCNPVTQARDVALLAQKYGILWHRGYNFFPRTPHIEHLVVLQLRDKGASQTISVI